MGSKAPPIPPDQRSAPNDKPHIAGARGGRKGAAGMNTREQGRQGAINQNAHHQQDR